MTSTPAGWFPDPEDPSQQRYWDGTAWTDHRAPIGGHPSQEPIEDQAGPSSVEPDRMDDAKPKDLPASSDSATEEESKNKVVTWAKAHKILAALAMLVVVFVI